MGRPLAHFTVQLAWTSAGFFRLMSLFASLGIALGRLFDTRWKSVAVGALVFVISWTIASLYERAWIAGLCRDATCDCRQRTSGRFTRALQCFERRAGISGYPYRLLAWFQAVLYILMGLVFAFAALADRR